MTNQLRIGLIDDEQSGLSVLEEFIKMIPGFIVSFAVTDPLIGFKMACERKADVIITDVKMPETGGLFIAGKLMELKIPVIFCSAYPEFLRNGYAVDAVDFLTKPADYDLLENALRRAASKIPAIPATGIAYDLDHIYVKAYGAATLDKIELKEVYYFEQKGNYTYIYFKDMHIVSVSRLNTVRSLLSPRQFVQIHRSYILNLYHIKRIHTSYVELLDGISVPVGRSYQKSLKSLVEYRTV
ncbi:LytTR family DNA-binding domain-containing protein [Algoriphagus sp. NG3]|uniref:LytR/AlgR family response regulator transcription factor n=1 Tax=unclassified Algoriphagus TaxID=2641541 RepID=UPI002A7F1B34|nr:LytTR family DNA-binding domain-containing protein [Algoriphagus sp. NG3]WPR76038.1 LytTR family DNA-binding domain-containing protein [Algoriphagus sp. NG3]